MRNSDTIKSNRIFSITHEQDVDGIFCAAILKNTFRNTLVFLTNHGHQNMKRVADVLATNVARSKKSGTIIFSDLSINSLEDVDTIEKSSSKAKEYGWNIVWLDHHYWNEEIEKRVQSFSKLILSPEHEQKCAAELVYQQFAKDRTALEGWPNLRMWLISVCPVFITFLHFLRLSLTIVVCLMPTANFSN